MKNNIRQLIISRAITVFLIISFLLSFSCVIGMSNVSAFEDDPIVVVSLGDSYSSGEGVEPFYGQEKDLKERIRDENWLAHRSKLGWPARLIINNKKTGDYPAEKSSPEMKWYFKAASGAVTDNFKDKPQKKTARKKLYTMETVPMLMKNTVELAPQLDVFKEIKDPVDYVTFTIGGNDVDFAEIITKCVTGSTYLGTSTLKEKLDNLWSEFYKTKSKLKQTYQDVQFAAGQQAAILVVGYPQLLDKSGEGIPISLEEAKMVNRDVHRFNMEIKALVKECKPDMNIHFVDVEEAFNKGLGHQAYSKEAWINKVEFVPKTQDINDFDIKSCYSMHPNSRGCQAYADCVNAEIEKIENQKQSGSDHSSGDSSSTQTTYPTPKERYWVVYEDGNSNHLMMSTLDSDYDADKLYIKWNDGLTFEGYYNDVKSEQYQFSSDGKWTYRATTDTPAEKAVRVLASNLDVYNQDGQLMVARSNWECHDWSEYSPLKSNTKGFVEIRTLEDLEYVRSNRTGKYLLMNDLDFSKMNEWTPIGARDRKKGGEFAFSGMFDGNGHKLINVSVTDDSSEGEVGFFGWIYKATIKNIADITGNYSTKDSSWVGAGGISGTAQYSTVTGCNTSVDISYFGGEPDGSKYTAAYGLAFHAGGIIGETLDFSEDEGKTTISRCGTYGKIQGIGQGVPMSVGGIFGTGTHVNISNCYSECDIAVHTDYVSAEVGGIAGDPLWESINNCYSACKLKVITSAEASDPWQSNVGGITGGGSNDSDTHVVNCYYLENSAPSGVGWVPHVLAAGWEIDADVLTVFSASKGSIDSGVQSLGLTKK